MKSRFKGIFIFLSMSILLAALSTCGGGGGGGGGGSSGTGSVTVEWDPPTSADGTPLTTVAGYKIHCGTSPQNYTQTFDVATATSYTAQGLPAGPIYCAVTAYDASGIESGYSNEVSK